MSATYDPAAEAEEGPFHARKPGAEPMSTKGVRFVVTSGSIACLTLFAAPTWPIGERS